MVQLQNTMNPVVFLREVKSELDKVVWPTKEKTIQLTILVLVVSVIVGTYIGSLDFIFTSLVNEFLLGK